MSKNHNNKTNHSLPLAFLTPNIITLFALFLGMLSIRFSIASNYFVACNLIFLAAFLDMIDGRVARMLKSSSRFGAELDSLVDMVNFGIAPAILIFTYFLDNTHYGWIAVYLYASCTAMRLARFNVSLEKDNQPKWIYNYFIGVPAPAGAILLMLPLYLFFVQDSHYGHIFPALHDPLLITIYTLFIGLLMILPLRTFSGKMYGYAVTSSMRKVILLFILLLIAVIYIFYWNSIIIICFIYLLHIPIAHNRYKKRIKASKKV